MRTATRHTLTSLIAPALLCLALLPQAVRAAEAGGAGQVATEHRSLPEFQAIALSGSMGLLVRQGATQSVQVQADDRLLPLLETVVEPAGSGGTLQLRWKKGQRVDTRAKVLVTVVVPKLTALSAAGSGDITVEQFSTPVLKLSIAGSSDAKLVGLSTAELGISISGRGDVGGSGSATRLKVNISGSGDVRLADMKSDDVTVAIAGSGDAAVNAGKTLEVKIAGSGDVVYSGNATVKSRVAGSGTVTRK